MKARILSLVVATTLVAAGALTVSWPALSHQSGGAGQQGMGMMRGGQMGDGQMGMMGGSHKGMMGGGHMDMMGGSHKGMMGGGHMGMMGGDHMGMMGGDHKGMMGGGHKGMMGGGHKGMMGGGHKGMMARLDLTAEQRTEIGDIRHAMRKKHWEIHGQMLDHRYALDKAYAEDIADPQKVGAIYGQIFDLRRQMIESSLAARNSMHGILTEDQREKMKEMKDGSNKMQHRPMRAHGQDEVTN